MKRIAIIGGGITGLAAAHRIRERGAEWSAVLFEAQDRLGGVLGTMRQAGCLIERSADMFTTRDPWALDLCRRIGFDNQLINTNSSFRKAFVVFRGKLEAVPEGFTLMSPARIWPVLKTPLLSWRGKARLAAEYFVPRKTDGADESLADFSRRRFGEEAYSRLIQPLIGGIYTADPTRLSMAATMRQFVDMEREHGSLIRGMRKAAKKQRGTAEATAADKQASGARYGLFVAPRDGMSSFVDAIAARLPPEWVRCQTRVTALERDAEGKWNVTFERQGQVRRESFEGAIVAAPASKAASLIAPWDQPLADLIAGIQLAGAAVVIGVYPRAAIRRIPSGFGFVVPLIEKRRILSGSLSSIKFAGRAPDDLVVTRAFLGGACQPELLDLTDEQLRQAAHEELSDLLGIDAAPVYGDVVRWHGTMPQYHVGHLDRVDRIERLTGAHDGLELAGNAYRGVGIPFCVRSGEAAADRIIEQL